MASQPPLPAGWHEAKDDRGRTYYFHEDTRQPQWKRPVLQPPPPVVAPEPEIIPPPPSYPPPEHNFSAMVEAEPVSEWKEVFDPKKGKCYYWNVSTGETTWKKPNPTPRTSVEETLPPPPVVAPEPQVPAALAPLPEGWYEVADKKTGKPYYWNVLTRAVTYQRPAAQKIARPESTRQPLTSYATPHHVSHQSSISLPYQPPISVAAATAPLHHHPSMSSLNSSPDKGRERGESSQKAAPPPPAIPNGTSGSPTSPPHHLDPMAAKKMQLAAVLTKQQRTKDIAAEQAKIAEEEKRKKDEEARRAEDERRKFDEEERKRDSESRKKLQEAEGVWRQYEEKSRSLEDKLKAEIEMALRVEEEYQAAERAYQEYQGSIKSLHDKLLKQSQECELIKKELQIERNAWKQEITTMQTDLQQSGYGNDVISRVLPPLPPEPALKSPSPPAEILSPDSSRFFPPPPSTPRGSSQSVAFPSSPSPPSSPPVADGKNGTAPPPPPFGDTSRDILQESSIMQLQMLEELNSFTARIKTMLDAKTAFSDEIIKDLLGIDKRCGSLRDKLRYDLDAIGIGRGSAIDILLGVDTEALKSPPAAFYRQTANKFNHATYRYSKWECPEYFSIKPLLSHIMQVTADISYMKGGRVNNAKMSITTADTARSIIEAASKSLGVAEKSTECVLKAVGYAEYMVGDTDMFKYDYIRRIARQGDGELCYLEIIKRPEAPKAALIQSNLQKFKQEYQGKLVEVKLPDPTKCIPLNKVTSPFRSQILSIDRCANLGLPCLDSSVKEIYVKSFLFHGVSQVKESVCITPPINVAKRAKWGKGGYLMATKCSLNSIPRETRACFLLYGKIEGDEDRLLAWVSIQCVDETGTLISGQMELGMWGLSRDAIEGKGKKKADKEKSKKEKKDKKDKKGDSTRDLGISEEKEGSGEDLMFIYRGPNCDQKSSVVAAVLHVKFDIWEKPIYAPTVLQLPKKQMTGTEMKTKSLPKQAREDMKKLMETDLMHELNPRDKELLWRSRGIFVNEQQEAKEGTKKDHALERQREQLPLLLRCVDWTNEKERGDAHGLLELWKPPTSMSCALQLLDCCFADYTVRSYAVDILRRQPDSVLQLFLVQLVQCLKYEPYHDSPLVRYLLERSLSNPFQIGHFWFWHMKAEMETHGAFRERFLLILEEYLSNAPEAAHELRKENNVVIQLQRIAEHIAQQKEAKKHSDQDLNAEYRATLSKLNRDFFERMPNGKFQLPLNPTLECTTLVVEKCRFMSSKKVPLWLVFSNADKNGKNVTFLFKSGDDLRQDILTLQMLRVMDNLWLEQGMDMRLTPYDVVATGVNQHGEGVGMIDAVLSSDTTSGIQMKHGGGVKGALLDTPLYDFIMHHNDKEKQQKAIENFTKSCAGYCVATYVLGIGDRHNGNIMIREDGHLFHIDFGHFLGNFKSKFGIKRERTPFVFTKQMAYVITGAQKNLKKNKQYQDFEEVCCRAYYVLRLNAIELENLFVLMVSAGMPELLVEQDIGYLREMLRLDDEEGAAGKWFKEQLESSVEDQWRRLDNAAHLAKHKG